MILINYIIIFFKIIVQELIFLFQQDSVNILLLKIVVSLILTSILYYMYHCVKQDYKFSKNYALDTLPKILFSFLIVFLYYSVFIFGFLLLRFYNVDKTLNLFVTFKLLLHIINGTNYFNLIITGYLVVTFLLLSKYIYYLLIQFIRFHKFCVYYFTFLREELSDKIYWFIMRNLTIPNLLRNILNQNIAYILYYLGFITIKPEKYNNKFVIPFSFQIYKGLPNFILIFTRFFACHAFKLHLYVLFIVFLYDILYNFYILENIYKITPYVFIYEMFVRMSKSIVVKNRAHDTFLAYYLYATCFEKNEDIITLGDKTWTQEEAYDIVADYAFNNFVDKKLVEMFLTPVKYDPFEMYETSYAKISIKINKIFKKNWIFIVVFFIALILYS